MKKLCECSWCGNEMTIELPDGMPVIAIHCPRCLTSSLSEKVKAPTSNWRKAHPTDLQQQAYPPRYDSTNHPSQSSFAIEQAWPVEGEGKLWTPPDNPPDQPEK